MKKKFLLFVAILLGKIGILLTQIKICLIIKKNQKILFTLAYNKDILYSVGKFMNITLKCIPKEIRKSTMYFHRNLLLSSWIVSDP